MVNIFSIHQITQKAYKKKTGERWKRISSCLRTVIIITFTRATYIFSMRNVKQTSTFNINRKKEMYLLILRRSRDCVGPSDVRQSGGHGAHETSRCFANPSKPWNNVNKLQDYEHISKGHPWHLRLWGNCLLALMNVTVCEKRSFT